MGQDSIYKLHVIFGFILASRNGEKPENEADTLDKFMPRRTTSQTEPWKCWPKSNTNSWNF